MRGLGAEVAKNLILAGVKGLTMLDHEQVSQEDSRAQFLIPSGSLGRNRAEASLERAQNLNPMVDVKVDTDNIDGKPEDYFTEFHAVCLTYCSRDVMVKVDQICHKHNVKFFTGDVFGYHGYMFANLGEHEFVEEKTKVAKVSQEVDDGPEAKKAKIDSTETTTMVKKKVQFCQLKEALEIDWSSEKAKAALKRTPADYFLFQVILKFRTDKGRDPQPSTYSEDSELLLQIRNDVLDLLRVSPDLLPEDFARTKSNRTIDSKAVSWTGVDYSLVLSSLIKQVKGLKLIPGVAFAFEAVAVNPQHVVKGALNASETGHP
ncbi:hypothetical protein FKM82_016117 [Ascaphus truei]